MTKKGHLVFVSAIMFPKIKRSCLQNLNKVKTNKKNTKIQNKKEVFIPINHMFAFCLRQF